MSNALDHEKMKRDQTVRQLLAATHKIFGDIPADPKFEQYMALFIESEKELYLLEKLQDALHYALGGNVHLIATMLQDCHKRQVDLTTEWQKLQEEWRQNER